MTETPDLNFSFVKTIAVSSAIALSSADPAAAGRDFPYEKQTHLSKTEQINQGSFYTPQKLVNLACDLIFKNIPDAESHTILDTSCGYGSFLENPQFKNRIGGDIDASAVQEAQKRVPAAKFFVRDALVGVARENYGLRENDKIIIIGNPPYNDTTSIIRSEIKEKSFSCDKDLKSRDMGMSFLLSYNKLNADYVCVLHPLSYLIKKSNFNAIRDFAGNYTLIDALVLPSSEFSDVSKSTAFPIVIALYKRAGTGMNHDTILNFEFKTIDGKKFSLNHWKSIADFVQKYPNQKTVPANKVVAKFYTLRDINALKRSQTFMKKTGGNTVFITQERLKYYCYLDVFKDFTTHIPYYLGNCDPMIDNEKFLEIEDCFLYASSLKHPELNFRNAAEIPVNYKEKIENYFKNLLGEHYVE